MDSIFDLDHLYRTYFKMALPSVFGLMVSVVYNLADTFFIAQSNDTALIAGVSLCAPVFTALMAFGNIYGQGGSSLISRLLGQDDREGTGRVSSFCFYVALTTGVVLAALMMLFRVPLLGILGATAETMPHAEAYYTVLAIGAPATVLNFIHSNLVRCEGMATQSMIGSIGGTVINIILDPILITTVGWGAGGAAIATIVGYLCSDLYFLWLLHKKSRCLSVKLSQCHVTGRELQQILGVGVTAALSNLMQSLTVIVMNQFLLPYGNDKIAAMGIASKVSMIAQLVLVGFSFGGIPLFGYLYGAKKRDVMRKLIRFCLTFLVSIAVVLSLILCLNSGALMRLFVQDAGMIATGAQMLRWQVYTAAFGGVVLLLTVLFQATGKIIPSFLLSISRQGVVFLLALVVCVHLFQYQGVLMASCGRHPERCAGPWPAGGQPRYHRKTVNTKTPGGPLKAAVLRAFSVFDAFARLDALLVGVAAAFHLGGVVGGIQHPLRGLVGGQHAFLRGGALQNGPPEQVFVHHVQLPGRTGLI